MTAASEREREERERGSGMGWGAELLNMLQQTENGGSRLRKCHCDCAIGHTNQDDEVNYFDDVFFSQTIIIW
jgi:hypothetical protein